MNQRERDFAILEGERINAAQEYFNARPYLQSQHSDRVFDAGFERGWKAAQAQQPAQEKPAPPFNDEIEEAIGYRLPNFGFDAVRRLMVEYAEKCGAFPWSKEQLPAWQYKIDVHGCHRFYSDEEDYPDGCTPLYTHPAPVTTAQEPAFWLSEQGQLSATRGWAECHAPGQKLIPLYTAAPRHKPLTDEQIMEVWEAHADKRDWLIDFAHGIVEAAITKEQT